MKHVDCADQLSKSLIIFVCVTLSFCLQVSLISGMINYHLNFSIVYAQILDSTEKAIEHSLASTGRANARTVEIYSESFNIVHVARHIFYYTCSLIMMVLLIRAT